MGGICFGVFQVPRERYTPPPSPIRVMICSLFHYIKLCAKLKLLCIGETKILKEYIYTFPMFVCSAGLSRKCNPSMTLIEVRGPSNNICG